jgi:hypothetical protein
MVPLVLAFATAAIVVGTAWYFLWHWTAAEVQQRVDATLGAIARSGIRVECERRQLWGFPLRLGLRCDSLALASVANGVAARSGSFRSAAQFYDPGRVVAEFDGPARIERIGDLPLLLDWELARVVSRFDLDGLRALSLQAQNLRLRDGLAPGGQPLVTLAEAWLDGRAATEREQDVDLAFIAEKLRPAGDFLPAIDLAGEVRLHSLSRYVRPGFRPIAHIREHGLTGEFQELSLATGDGGVARVSGPFDIGSDGAVSAKLTVSVGDVDRLADFLIRLVPEHRQILEAAAQVVILAGSRNAETPDERRVTLAIDRGMVMAGPLPIGKIAPLFETEAPQNRRSP